jgi:uncharacterized protein DUF4340
MKIHGLVIALVVLAILGGVLYWSNHHQAQSSTTASADAPPTILKLDPASVTQFELKRNNAAPIVLTKDGSGDWQITEPQHLRADQDAVSGVVSTLSSLTAERLVNDKASDLAAYGLAQPAVELDVTDKNHQTKKLLLGDNTPASSGVYGMLAGDPRVFTVGTYTKTSIDKNLDDLRDKRLITLAADKVSRVELVRKGQDIEFGRSKDDWQILKPKPLRADGAKVGDLVRDLTDAKMDLSTPARDAATAFDHATPVATAKLTVDSGTQELQIRKDTKGVYYAKAGDVKGAYKVDSSLGAAVDKGLEDFRDKKLFDFGYDEPQKIELHNGTKSYYLVQGSGGSNDWWSNGKKMDGASVESVISDLRDLSADKFPDSGFSAPTVEATVVSNSWKRTENVQLAKSGDHYIAKRDGDPTLYELDASSVDALLKAASEVTPAPAAAVAKK